MNLKDLTKDKIARWRREGSRRTGKYGYQCGDMIRVTRPCHGVWGSVFHKTTIWLQGAPGEVIKDSSDRPGHVLVLFDLHDLHSEIVRPDHNQVVVEMPVRMIEKDGGMDSIDFRSGSQYVNLSLADV